MDKQVRKELSGIYIKDGYKIDKDLVEYIISLPSIQHMIKKETMICEWTEDKRYYTASCNRMTYEKRFWIIKDRPYCPCCGKRIKMKEFIEDKTIEFLAEYFNGRDYTMTGKQEAMEIAKHILQSPAFRSLTESSIDVDKFINSCSLSPSGGYARCLNCFFKLKCIKKIEVKDGD